MVYRFELSRAELALYEPDTTDKDSPVVKLIRLHEMERVPKAPPRRRPIFPVVIPRVQAGDDPDDGADEP